jgi:hypothetical protein
LFIETIQFSAGVARSAGVSPAVAWASRPRMVPHMKAGAVEMLRAVAAARRHDSRRDGSATTEYSQATSGPP